MLVLFKIDSMYKSIAKDKEGQLQKLKGPAYQDDKLTVNLYLHYNIARTCMKQKLTIPYHKRWF